MSLSRLLQWGDEMVVSLLEYIVFFACFGLCFYALSCVDFARFCHVRQPVKVTLLMFILSLVLAYVMMQAVLQLTIYNGFGV